MLPFKKYSLAILNFRVALSIVAEEGICMKKSSTYDSSFPKNHTVAFRTVEAGMDTDFDYVTVAVEGMRNVLRLFLSDLTIDTYYQYDLGCIIGANCASAH